MIRRRSTPWIHKWSRPIIGAIAGLGILNTGYLTYEKLTGGSPLCTTPENVKGCADVLSSPWGTVFGQPLALFGLLGYVGMFVLALAPLTLKSGEKDKIKNVKQIEFLTWWLLLMGAIAMTVFSAYLMYVLAFELKALCWYCIASALFALSMLTLTILGRDWEDIGQIFFTAIIVGMVTLIATLGVYSGINADGTVGSADGPQRISAFVPKENPNPAFGWEITTTSGESEIALAEHLVKVGAKEYVAYWCPHCHEQKLLFGKEAYKIINDNIAVECAADSPKGKPALCQAAKIQGFPSWVINGQIYGGVQNLNELAKITGYTGPQNFKYFR
ncbi:vitamin K epoxide reductase family protein [Sphaerospermopsis sp. LEGE 08334]|uniref:vitamin K epoxide reductase family protein n=1 Tax=Sphaerospermopsis sp. LEGE 08334 TaxID=1828651 RepID=UPI00187E35FD|nr:vitamin K epoxide reductase family protein [Sphaerospermopsis sp. LEGE 08334]MBE9056022.1 vitamin K epoxide reductase family protein [Sphaerospermopsis sp. LEGE 08334]